MSTEEELVRHAIENFEGPWPTFYPHDEELVFSVRSCESGINQYVPIDHAIAIIGYALAKAGAVAIKHGGKWYAAENIGVSLDFGPEDTFIDVSGAPHPTHFHALFASAVAQGIVKQKP
jgi:hypothetical protein